MTSYSYRLKALALSPRTRIRRRRHEWRPAPVRRQLDAYRYSNGIQAALLHSGLDPQWMLHIDVPPAPVVVDVASFVGYFADAWVDTPKARVLCFEGNTNAANLIAKTQGGANSIIVANYLLGCTTREATLSMAGPRSVVDSPDLGFGVQPVQIREATEALRHFEVGEIDLLRVGSCGLEFELVEHLVATGWIGQVGNLLLQCEETAPGAYRRYAQLRRSLRKTHSCVFRHPWVWELWRKSSA